MQVDFAYALFSMRQTTLQNALLSTVGEMDIAQLDQELAQFAPRESLAILARHGLRGEIVFCVPALIKANPYLVGYYRLLLGYSRKSFYEGGNGLGAFKRAEDAGKFSLRIDEALDEFCGGINKAASYLVNKLESNMIKAGFLDDLTLLTLGSQLRGGVNVKLGTAAINDVFKLIHDIVNSSITAETPHSIELINSANRKVFIGFSNDPDIFIRDEMVTGNMRNIIAIEVKGGQDFSNIHNRMGEAEKSHQKAHEAGYTECWTVINVDQADLQKCKLESPTTDRFYRISQLLDTSAVEYLDFKDRLISLTSII